MKYKSEKDYEFDIELYSKIKLGILKHWDSSGLDTFERVSMLIYDDLIEENQDKYEGREEEIADYFCAAFVELFGIPKNEEFL